MKHIEYKPFFAALLALTVIGMAASLATLGVRADDEVTILTASLRGVNEVPAINSNATATFRAVIHSDGSITFKETFSGLTSNAILSHIHFGEVHVKGDVMIFLCGGAASRLARLPRRAPSRAPSLPRMSLVQRHRGLLPVTSPALCAPSAREQVT